MLTNSYCLHYACGTKFITKGRKMAVVKCDSEGKEWVLRGVYDDVVRQLIKSQQNYKDLDKENNELEDSIDRKIKANFKLIEENKTLKSYQVADHTLIKQLQENDKSLNQIVRELNNKSRTLRQCLKDIL